MFINEDEIPRPYYNIFTGETEYYTDKQIRDLQYICNNDLGLEPIKHDVTIDDYVEIIGEA